MLNHVDIDGGESAILFFPGLWPSLHLASMIKTKEGLNIEPTIEIWRNRVIC